MTKKFALVLFSASAILNIFLTGLIIQSNNKKTVILAKVDRLEEIVNRLEKEVFITPDQLQLSPQRVSEVLKDARRLEGTETTIIFKPTTKISRQLFMQGLFYSLFQQFHGADKFSIDNRLPNFRQMQWILKTKK